MDNDNYNPNNDPNKKKKCSCEDKYGPKPFSDESESKKQQKNNEPN